EVEASSLEGSGPSVLVLSQSGDMVGLVATGDENFSLARLGTGCENWKEIGMGETVVTASANQCAGLCRRSPRCIGVNWQPRSCKGGEQVQRGACILLGSACSVEENPCWDLYDVSGSAVPQGNSEGTVAETTPSSTQTTVTLRAEAATDDPVSEATSVAETTPSSMQMTATLPAGTTTDDPQSHAARDTVQATFALPAETIPDDPELQAAVLEALQEMLAEETGAAHVSVALIEEWGEEHAEELAALPRQRRRLRVAAPEQEVEVTFTPASAELAATIDKQHDVLKSKICETAARVARELDWEASGAVGQDQAGPSAAAVASRPESSQVDSSQSDVTFYIVLGVLGTMMLGGCVAVVQHHEDQKMGLENPRGFRRQLVPPGGGNDKGADEQAMELQQAQEPPSRGFGDALALAETDLVHSAAAGATALHVRSTHGFGRGDRVQIMSGKGSETKVVCGFDEATGAMLVYNGLFYTHAMGALVSKAPGPPARWQHAWARRRQASGVTRRAGTAARSRAKRRS
ncbi:unnamed protein product, partial [Prorocentrum cordatum]